MCVLNLMSSVIEFLVWILISVVVHTPECLLCLIVSSPEVLQMEMKKPRYL